MKTQSSDVASIAILFSGGRDSTLATLIYHRQGSYLHLLSFDSGLGYGSELRMMRVRELQRAFGEDTHTWRLLPNYGLVKLICFSELVSDIKQDGCQQLLLGESLAMFARAIDYCLANDIRMLAIGASGYQANFAEQTPVAIEFFKGLCEDYGLTLVTPVLQYASELEVKEALLLAGLSSKSLEASTILSDLDGETLQDVVLQYLVRKRPIVDAFLKRWVPEDTQSPRPWA